MFKGLILFTSNYGFLFVSIRCICGALKGKPRILVTHQLQYLKAADEILVLKEVCLDFFFFCIFALCMKPVPV